MCYRRIDRTIVKYLKNKAIIFIESDSMLQKKKKKKKRGVGKKRSRCALFPSGQSWKGNWNISGLIKSRGNIIVNAWSLDPFHPVILIYSVHSVRGNRNFIEIKCISALAMEAGDKFLIAHCVQRESFSQRMIWKRNENTKV